MLGKLLKYEIPALGRKLVPLYIGWAATAVLLGLMIGPLESKSDFMMVLSAMLYTGVATAVFVMAIVMIVQRYNNSLLGDEGYFSHVLPVKADSHIASKTISALIWILLSFVAMAVTGIIIAVFSGNFLNIFTVNWGEFFREMYSGMTPMSWICVLELIIACVLSIAKSILAIYTALTIGHQAPKRVGLASIGAYIGVLVFEVLIARVLAAIFPRIFINPETITETAILFFIAIVVTIVIGGIYFFICRYLLGKRLNLA